ncbi:MAG TPA: gfo/Idh/MocA family oxidoreductase, partial [Methylomirabilota bacterium]|nr:gfo/Idh/MocA family oxidoreductase [Methylomirabilota bacterium]
MTSGARERHPLGWGVIGATSYVAQRAVLPAIAASAGGRVVALASERPDALAARFDARVHPSYEALLADPEVDA